MLPKTIHYCWFGGAEKPELVFNCINSWKKFCPDYEIIEWNESNYDITKNPYMYQAYQKKRWGFVTDYARLEIVYEYGGLYFDTDVEFIRSLDELVVGDGFVGFEKAERRNQKEYSVNTGQGFGAKKGDSTIRHMLDVYDSLQFTLPDGTENLTPSPNYNTKALVDLGMRRDNSLQKIGELTVYPADYFCPRNYHNKKTVIMENTFSIHHFDGSWLSEEEKRRRAYLRIRDKVIHLPNRMLMSALGNYRYEQLKKKLKG